MTISIILATTLNYTIGYKGDLIHRDPIDMKHFKELTTNNVVIMGRKTYESLPNGALPDRYNIVVSSGQPICITDSVWENSLEHAINYAESVHPDKDIFIIGGASLYHEALDKGLVDIAYVTEYDFVATNADTFINYDKIRVSMKSAGILDDWRTELAPNKTVYAYLMKYVRKTNATS